MRIKERIIERACDREPRGVQRLGNVFIIPISLLQHDLHRPQFVFCVFTVHKKWSIIETNVDFYSFNLHIHELYILI